MGPVFVCMCMYCVAKEKDNDDQKYARGRERMNVCVQCLGNARMPAPTLTYADTTYCSQ